MFKYISLFLTISFIYANDNSFYQTVFPDLAKTRQVKVVDKISDNPINTSVQIAYNTKGKKLGFIREVNTTTGCDSACLPVIFTLFYNTKYEFIKLKSKVGLTKKFHKPMTDDDLNRLQLLLGINPQIFKSVKDPKELTDALSGATKPAYVDSVVKDAAYSTLRINLYNQDTIIQLKNLGL